MSRKTKFDKEFLCGVFASMQFLVLVRDEPTIASEIAKQFGIKRDWALRESKLTGFRVREMNQFIRENLQ